jgi:hypothetical protein
MKFIIEQKLTWCIESLDDKLKRIDEIACVTDSDMLKVNPNSI